MVWLGEAQEALSSALHALAANRLRAVLTTVGIIAGVGSVIMMVAMGDGMTKGFNDQFTPFASQLLIKPIHGQVANGKGLQPLTENDYHAMHNRTRAPDIADLSAAVVGVVSATVDQKKDGASLFGVEENFLELNNERMVAGSWFTSQQINDGVRQAVLGQEVLNELWGPGTDPNDVIGEEMRVGHSNFKVQGVVNVTGSGDNDVMVPILAARSYVVGSNGGKLDLIVAKSPNIATVGAARDELTQILDVQHHVRTKTERDYKITDNISQMQQQQSTIRFLRMFIVSIAAISLFVGGVGVGNIMLVSVTERTREIGIRKAIGAPRRAIMRQFLSEAVLVTALGGLVGIVFGIGLCLLGQVVIPKLMPPDPSSMAPTPVPVLSVYPIIIAFGVSLAIGLLAGGYPAYRASRLRPIQALRFE